MISKIQKTIESEQGVTRSSLKVSGDASDKDFQGSILDSQGFQGSSSTLLNYQNDSTGTKKPDVLKALRLPIHCPRCKWHRGQVERLDSGPHAAKLTCSACDRWIKWISKARLDQIVSAASEGIQGGAE